MTAATLTETDLDMIERTTEHACANFRSVAGQALPVTPEQTAEVVALVIAHYKLVATFGIDRATADVGSNASAFDALVIAAVLSRDAQRAFAARALDAPAIAPAAWSPRAADILNNILTNIGRAATTEGGPAAGDLKIIRTEITALLGARPQETP